MAENGRWYSRRQTDGQERENHGHGGLKMWSVALHSSDSNELPPLCSLCPLSCPLNLT